MGLVCIFSGGKACFSFKMKDAIIRIFFQKATKSYDDHYPKTRVEGNILKFCNECSAYFFFLFFPQSWQL